MASHLPKEGGAPSTTRTCDLLVRRPVRMVATQSLCCARPLPRGTVCFIRCHRSHAIHRSRVSALTGAGHTPHSAEAKSLPRLLRSLIVHITREGPFTLERGPWTRVVRQQAPMGLDVDRRWPTASTTSRTNVDEMCPWSLCEIPGHGNRSRSLLWATTPEWRRDDEGRASTPTMMAWKASFWPMSTGTKPQRTRT